MWSKPQHHLILSNVMCSYYQKNKSARLGGEDVEKTESLYTVGGNTNWYNREEKNYGGSSKDKNGQPYDLAIPLLYIYPKELKLGSWRDMCTLMLTVVIFTIAKICKQTKCPLTN